MPGHCRAGGSGVGVCVLLWGPGKPDGALKQQEKKEKIDQMSTINSASTTCTAVILTLGEETQSICELRASAYIKWLQGGYSHIHSAIAFKTHPS